MRVGIVGASTLLGRELADVIGETVLSAAEVLLLDEEEATGQITAVGDEPALIQRLDHASFTGMDLCFFTASTGKYWKIARDAGVRVIDLTHKLRSEPGIAIGMPWVDGLGGIDMATTAIVPADAAAVILALVASRCKHLVLTTLSATLLVPASERGRAGLDEMQQQAVALLSFQPVPMEEFDAQVAFNLIPSLGVEARLPMQTVEDRIRSDYAMARSGTLPALALQMVHAPVFHGYGISIVLSFGEAVTAGNVEAALATGGHIEVVSDTSHPPSNLTAAGRPVSLAQVSNDTAGRIWVWITADNVRLAALQAIACGMEMRRLIPYGKVQ